MRYLIRGLPFRFRLMLFVCFAAVGIVLQTVLPGFGIPGFLLVVAAAVLMLAKSYKNKPGDLGFEDWKPVSFAEFQRIRTNLERSKKSTLPVYYRRAGVAVFIVPALLLLFISAFFSVVRGGSRLPTIVINCLVLAVPLFVSGLVKLWIPKELSMKVALFYPLSLDDKGDDITATPYLRFDRDKEKREIPEDVRFMIEMRRNPEDFVGIQLQIAVNNGPNGAVPYMYAVYLCRGKDETYRKIAKMDFAPYIKETGGDEEYGTIVIRQRTSGGGYQTTPDQCERLYGSVVDRLREI